MDKLKGALLEEDYTRYSQKFIFVRANLSKQKEELEENQREGASINGE